MTDLLVSEINRFKMLGSHPRYNTIDKYTNPSQVIFEINKLYRRLKQKFYHLKHLIWYIFNKIIFLVLKTLCKIVPM